MLRSKDRWQFKTGLKCHHSDKLEWWLLLFKEKKVAGNSETGLSNQFTGFFLQVKHIGPSLVLCSENCPYHNFYLNHNQQIKGTLYTPYKQLTSLEG